MDNQSQKTMHQSEPQVSSNPSPESSSSIQSDSKKRKIILFIILFLVGITLLFFTPLPYYQSQNALCKVGAVNCPIKGWHLGLSLWQQLHPNYISGRPIEQSQTTVVTPTLAPQIKKEENKNTDTSTWQTYRNEEFGFEVRYP